MNRSPKFLTLLSAMSLFNEDTRTRLRKLSALLSKSWTILPRRTQTFPEPNSWWPILIIWVVLGSFTIAALYYDPYSPHNVESIKPLVGLPPAPPASPRFTEGDTVEVSPAGSVYADPGIDQMPELMNPELARGTVLDGRWEQGQWFYLLRFNETRKGWVAERHLTRLPRATDQRG